MAWKKVCVQPVAIDVDKDADRVRIEGQVYDAGLFRTWGREGLPSGMVNFVRRKDGGMSFEVQN